MTSLPPKSSGGEPGTWVHYAPEWGAFGACRISVSGFHPSQFAFFHRRSRVAYLGMESKTLLPGTLDLLLLKALSLEPMHGYGIAQRLRQISGDVFQVEEGTLYPALQRLLARGWVAGEWKQTENNRRARYYKLSASGRKQLQTQRAEFEKVLGAIVRVMEAM